MRALKNTLNEREENKISGLKMSKIIEQGCRLMGAVGIITKDGKPFYLKIDIITESIKR
jgi:hypothetical protein